MVFGWGKKRPEAPPERRAVGLADVPGIVAESDGLRESRALEEIKKIREDTVPLVDGLARIGRLLEDDDLRMDDVDKHISVIVVRGKKQVIDVIKKGAVPLPEVKGMADAEALDAAMGAMLKKVGDVLGRQTRVIHIFAKKYAQQLKDSLAVMDANQKEAHRIVSEYKSRREASARILGLVDGVRKAEDAASAASARREDARARSEKAGAELESVQRSADEARASDEYKKYVEKRGELDRAGSERERIRSDVAAQFAKISRPLGRYEYGSSLDKDQKGLLGALVSDPYEALHAGDQDVIITILENVRKAISSGSISVKDVDKSLAHITETEEALGGLVRRISGYESGREALQKEVDSLRPARLESLERDAARLASERDTLLARAKELEAEAADAKSSIPGIISDIESLLGGHSGARYSVEYP